MNLNWAGCKKKCEIFYWQCFLLSAHNLALRPQKCLKCMVKGHRFSLLLHNSIQLSWAFSKVYIPTTININYFLWHLQFIVLVVYPILTQRNNKAKLKIFHLILNFLFLFFFLPNFQKLTLVKNDIALNRLNIFKLVYLFCFFFFSYSLIGLAVGSEKFTPDAAEVMEMLLKTQTGDNELTDDDPQMSYMIR